MLFAIVRHSLACLSQYELQGDYPDWLIINTQPLDDMLSESLEPSQKFLDSNERLGISVTAGIASSIIAKKLVKKLAGKTFFKAITSRIGGLTAASTTAAAAGPGTAAAAVVASLAVDIALQKADEAMNREKYRDELISAIEEQRQETLAAIRFTS